MNLSKNEDLIAKLKKRCLYNLDGTQKDIPFEYLEIINKNFWELAK